MHSEGDRRRPGGLLAERGRPVDERAGVPAAAHGIGNAEFEIMSLDALTLPGKSADGSYTFPMACRLFWGSK